MAPKQTRKEAANQAAKAARRVGTEEDWDAIQQRAISEAEQIKCPLSDYLSGLKTMRLALSERIAQVESEIQVTDPDR